MHLPHILYDNPSTSNQITTLIHIEFRLFRASILGTLNNFHFQQNILKPRSLVFFTRPTIRLCPEPIQSKFQLNLCPTGLEYQYRSRLVFERYSVRILARAPGILTEASHGFNLSRQTSVKKRVDYGFLPEPSQFNNSIVQLLTASFNTHRK